MDRRMCHTPRYGRDLYDRRKSPFDRRRHGPVFRFAYGITLLPLGRLLNAVSGGRIPVRPFSD